METTYQVLSKVPNNSQTHHHSQHLAHHLLCSNCFNRRSSPPRFFHLPRNELQPRSFYGQQLWSITRTGKAWLLWWIFRVREYPSYPKTQVLPTRTQNIFWNLHVGKAFPSFYPTACSDISSSCVMGLPRHVSHNRIPGRSDIQRRTSVQYCVRISALANRSLFFLCHNRLTGWHIYGRAFDRQDGRLVHKAEWRPQRTRDEVTKYCG